MSGSRDLAIVCHPRSKRGVCGYLWVLLTYDIAVATGWEPLWRPAYMAAVNARKAYLAKQKSMKKKAVPK